MNTQKFLGWLTGIVVVIYVGAIGPFSGRFPPNANTSDVSCYVRPI